MRSSVEIKYALIFLTSKLENDTGVNHFGFNIPTSLFDESVIDRQTEQRLS